MGDLNIDVKENDQLASGYKSMLMTYDITLCNKKIIMDDHNLQYNDFSYKLKQCIELSTKNKIKKEEEYPTPTMGYNGVHMSKPFKKCPVC